LVQDALGSINAGAYDLSAACSGFIYGLAQATNAIRCGAAQNVLVIGAETMSRIINWKDRGTCILFGDGAGAFVLQGSTTPGGILSNLIRSDGSGAHSLTVPAGGSRLPTTFDTVKDKLHTIHMDGKEVYRFATRVMVSAAREVVECAGLSMDDIALVVPHQANRRIIVSAARSLGLPEDRFMINLDRYGNTSSASIPIAVCEAVEQGRLRPNDHMVMVGFGGGLTWGATAVQWNVTPKADASAWHRLGRQTFYGFSRVRSAVRRGLRRVEGVVYGKQGAEGVEPPHRTIESNGHNSHKG
jgi:3-oxoacyl-[acyl-carrier-protein] synthase-3